MMTLRQIELFLALAREQHVSRVAQDHFLTQSAVSVAIRSFEEAIGEKLFDRLGNRVVLNGNGRLLFEQLEPVYSRLLEVGQIFRKSRIAGTLLIGASSTIADFILPQILYEFREVHPGATVRMITGNTHEVIDSLERGEIDLGFVEGDFQSSALQSTALCTDELHVITADKSFADGGEYTLKELLPRKWVLRERGSGTRDTLFRHLGRQGDKLNIFLELDHTAAVKQVVMRNPDTIACTSPFSIAHELSQGTLHAVHVKDTHFTRTLYTVFHRKRYRTSLMEAFAEAVQAYVGEHGELFKFHETTAAP